MTTSELEKKLRPYQEPVHDSFLKWLLTHFPPRPITNGQMYRDYSSAVHILLDAVQTKSENKRLTEVIRTYLRMITPFLEDYDKKEFTIKSVLPEDMLRYFMEEHGLSQYDIAKEVGGQPVASAILNGKRKLSREQIERLSKRFGIHPASFYGK